MVSEKKFKAVVNEIDDESCACKDGFCFWREFVKAQHPDIRTLIQLQAILKFKFLVSEHEGHDIGNQEAMLLWVNSGLAKKFAEVYDEEQSFKQIFQKVMCTFDFEKRTVK